MKLSFLQMFNRGNYSAYIYFLSFIFCSGCASHVVYIPNAVPVPLQKNKKDLHVTLNLSNAQVTYAFSNHFSVMANGFFRSYSQKREDYLYFLIPFARPNPRREKGKQHLAEVALGYHRIFKDKWIVECYGGYGIGNSFISTEYDDSPGEVDKYYTRMKRAFIQPNVGFVLGAFEFALSNRLSTVDFYHTRTNFDLQGLNNYGNLNEIPNTIYCFTEPALTVRGGNKLIMGQLQVSRSWELNNQLTMQGETPWMKDVMASISIHIALTKEAFQHERDWLFRRRK